MFCTNRLITLSKLDKAIIGFSVIVFFNNSKFLSVASVRLKCSLLSHKVSVFPKVCYLDYEVSSVQAPQVKDCFYRFFFITMQTKSVRITKQKIMSEDFSNTYVKGKNLAEMNDKYKRYRR